MKKILFSTFLLVSLFFGVNAFAQDAKNVNVYLFWSSGCPHCAKEKEFLDDLKIQKPNIKIIDFEVSKSFSSARTFSDVGKYLNADTRGVPFTVIGSQHFIGFGDAETTGKMFIKAIEKVESGEDEDILAEFLGIEIKDNSTEPESDVELGPGSELEPAAIPDPESNPAPKKEKKPLEVGEHEVINLSIFGKINPKEFSLPVLTFLIALVDGFNPCAMWVLLFLISLLLGFKDKKRMWILGLTFIAASAFVYFLFMAAWLNFFLFFGFIIWIRIIVGLVAIFFAYKNIRSFIEDKDGGCEVTKDEKRINTLQKIKDITKKENLLPAIGGIVLLAFAVNLIEAVCSAGLPAIYTQILTLNKLPTWKYYSYIIFYQVVFMLDDMVIFVIAMLTMSSVGIESKYVRWSKIIGGVVMLIIGLLLIFKPELLLLG